MRFFFTFCLLILNINISFSQYIFEKLFTLPYGEKSNEIFIRKANGGIYGPSSFVVKNNNIIILDSENNLLKFFSPYGKLNYSIKIPQFSNDFDITEDKIYVLHDQYYLSVFDKFGSIEQKTIQFPISKYPPNRISIKNDILQLKNGRDENEFYKIEDQSVFNKMSVSYDNQLFYKTVKTGNSVFKIIKTNYDGQILGQFVVDDNSSKIASVEFLDSDLSGNLYFNEEIFINEIPCEIERYILKMDENGKLLAKIKLPKIYYSKIQNDIFISPGGDIYYLLSNRDYIEVIRLKKSEIQNFEKVIIFPNEYNIRFHYNQSLEVGEPEGTKLYKDSKPLLMVNRDESVQIGDKYVKYQWECQAKNITPDTIIASDGKLVCTPSWIAIGQNIKIPYKWGGFSTIEDFYNGLIAGKYAGDRYTNKSSGSSACVGVDCSGFVSRCWKLSSHYSTSAMPSILQPLGSWSNIQRGDAVHKVGHVRLCVDNNPNGTLNVVESSGNDWRVSYRTYNYNNLTGYTPNRYINMQENATSIDSKTELSNPVLFANYPNPFNNSTRIVIKIQNAQHIKLQIYDYLGRMVKKYQNISDTENLSEIYWDGKSADNLDLSGGIYICRLSYSTFDGKSIDLSRKLIILK